MSTIEQAFEEAKKQMDERLAEFEKAALARLGDIKPTPAKPAPPLEKYTPAGLRQLVRAGALTTQQYLDELNRRSQVAIQKAADLGDQAEARLVGKTAEMTHLVKRAEEKVQLSKAELVEELLGQLEADPFNAETFATLVSKGFDGDQTAATRAFMAKAGEGAWTPAGMSHYEFEKSAEPKRQPWTVATRKPGELQATGPAKK